MIIFENSVPTLTIALCLGGAVLAAAYSAFRYLPSGAFRVVLFGLHVLALLGLALGLHGCAQSPAVAPRTYDVVVYGDSAAAVAAAVQAKRQGLLVETGLRAG